MRVFERIGRIVRADAHGVMDQIEERSLLLKQHLREAEFELIQKRAKLEAVEAVCRRMSEEGRDLESRVTALDEDVELAMAGEDADLARFAIRRLLPQREGLRLLFAQAAEEEKHRSRLADHVEMQEAQLAELRPRVRAALARRDPPAVEFVEPISDPVSNEEVDLELLRRREAREDREDGGGEFVREPVEGASQ